MLGTGCVLGGPEDDDAELRSLTDVAMVQAADLWKLHDPSGHGKLDRPDVRGILVEREVGARLMILGAMARQEATELSLAEDERMGLPRNYPGSCSQREPKNPKATYCRSANFRTPDMGVRIYATPGAW